MKLPLQITFRGVDKSEGLEAKVRRRAAKLDRLCDQIMGCRVVVEAPHHHHHTGNHFHVRVEVSVPGEELVVSRDPHQRSEHEDLWIVLRDAFDAAERQLAGYQSRRRSARPSAAPRPDVGLSA